MARMNGLIISGITERLQRHVMRSNMREISRKTGMPLSSVKRFKRTGNTTLQNGEKLLNYFGYVIVGIAHVDEVFAETDPPSAQGKPVNSSAPSHP